MPSVFFQFCFVAFIPFYSVLHQSSRWTSVAIKLSWLTPQVINGPRGVTVSTLDSESSDRGSNPREASYHSMFYSLTFDLACCLPIQKMKEGGRQAGMQKEMQKRERNCLPMKKMEESGRQKEMQKEMQHKRERQIEREREREREREKSKAQVFCAAKCTLSISSPRTAWPSG